MKKNVILRIAAVVLMCTLVTACFASSTFAKYTSQATGTSTATVAKWSVKVNGTDIAQTSSVTFDLFDKSKVYQLSGMTGSAASWTGADDANVTNGTTNAIVAPGTWGKVNFAITNESDVTAAYAIKITSLTTTLPIKFSVDGTTWVAASDIDVGDDGYLLTSTTTPTIAAHTTTAQTLTLYWKWDFSPSGTQDTADTNLGKAGTATCAITAGVDFTQVD